LRRWQHDQQIVSADSINAPPLNNGVTRFLHAFYFNHTNIVKVTLRDGIAEIIALETRSALPLEDKVAISMAVISRTGVQFIQAGTDRIAVSADH
jgi:hypothetical protein